MDKLSVRYALGHCFPYDIINRNALSTKCFAIWDLNTLLSHIQHKDISTFYDITKELAMLLMIISGTRVNILVHFKVTNMYNTDNEVTFPFDEVLKHFRPS